MTTADLPLPLVTEDVDLRDFSFTPMFRSRLFGSSFHARVSDQGWRAGVTLWLKSWDQVPAGTLPQDEIDLCRLAELGRDLRSWRKVSKEALWGWFECSDGRLHHRTVAAGVLEAWAKKQAQRARTSAAREAALARRRAQETASVTGDNLSVTDNQKGCDTTSVTDSKGQYKGQGYSNDINSTTRDHLSVGKQPTRRKHQYSQDFELFWKAYPTSPIMSKKEAYDVWRRLPEDERIAATKALPAFKSYLASHPDYETIHACRFLSKRRAEGLLESAERISSAAGVFVKQGTPQWDAWSHAKGKTPPTNKDGGWFFPSEWPPPSRASDGLH